MERFAREIEEEQLRALRTDAQGSAGELGTEDPRTPADKKDPETSPSKEDLESSSDSL